LHLHWMECSGRVQACGLNRMDASMFPADFPRRHGPDPVHRLRASTGQASGTNPQPITQPAPKLQASPRPMTRIWPVPTRPRPSFESGPQTTPSGLKTKGIGRKNEPASPKPGPTGPAAIQAGPGRQCRAPGITPAVLGLER
jgi:hypothetical protein